MPLILTITPAQGQGRSADRQVRTLAQGSLSIGRAAGNDWVLADPDQHLSRTHCMISYDAGRYVLTDLSTNGMLINGAREPTSRNSRIVLTDGDSVRLGGYMLEVAEADGPAGAVAAGGFGAASTDPFGAGGRLDGDNPLDVDPLDAPFGNAAALGFQHPMPHQPPSVRTNDPFDVARNDRGRPSSMDDSLFRPVSARDAFKGPTPGDNADARSQAYTAPRVLPSVNLDDIDFDALIGDMGPAAAHPSSPTARPAPVPSVTPPAAKLPQGHTQASASPFDELSFDDLLSDPAPVQQPAVPPVAATPVHAPPVQVPQSPPAVPEPPPVPQPAAAAPGPTAVALIAAFLDGAGVPRLEVPTDNPEATMRAIGVLFQAFVEGTREVLMSRAEIKQEMRVERTMLRARDNNALKFSVSATEAVAALLQPNRPGYKVPLAAVEEAFRDIRSHEMAVMAGMQTALLALLGRFDPASLEARLQRGMLDSILPGARKARFWEVFCSTYKDIAREAADDFHSAFGRQFAEAYDKQVGNL